MDPADPQALLSTYGRLLATTLKHNTSCMLSDQPKEILLESIQKVTFFIKNLRTTNCDLTDLLVYNTTLTISTLIYDILKIPLTLLFLIGIYLSSMLAFGQLGKSLFINYFVKMCSKEECLFSPFTSPYKYDKYTASDFLSFKHKSTVCPPPYYTLCDLSRYLDDWGITTKIYPAGTWEMSFLVFTHFFNIANITLQYVIYKATSKINDIIKGCFLIDYESQKRLYRITNNLDKHIKRGNPNHTYIHLLIKIISYHNHTMAKIVDKSIANILKKKRSTKDELPTMATTVLQIYRSERYILLFNISQVISLATMGAITMTAPLYLSHMVNMKYLLWIECISLLLSLPLFWNINLTNE